VAINEELVLVLAITGFGRGEASGMMRISPTCKLSGLTRLLNSIISSLSALYF